METRLAEANIRWRPLPYHKRPPVVSTARDVAAAVAVVTLTQASIPVLREWIKIAGGDPVLEVIPTCVDLGRFQPAPQPDGDGTFQLVLCSQSLFRFPDLGDDGFG